MLAVHAHYAQRGQSLAGAALAGAAAFVRWSHYPRDDVDDGAHGTRFFYHAHEQSDMLGNEHGHFHVFTRGESDKPFRYAHLVGVSLDDRGTPLRLFTTNEWVTGEDWMPADQMTQAVHRFCVQTTGRLAPVARWLTALIQFYAHPIVSLLHARDAALQAHATRHQQDRTQAQQDRSLHIASEMRLSDHWKFLQEERVL